jgi:hypothetical protein
MSSLNDANGTGICLSVGGDEQTRLYDLGNRVQFSAEAEILSAAFSLSLGPAQPPVYGGIGSPFNRLKRPGRKVTIPTYSTGYVLMEL